MKPLSFLPKAGALLLLCACALPAFAIDSDPSVIAFDDGTGMHRIYAFARGDRGTLVVNFWSNISGTWQWQWADLGVPYGSRSIYDPSAVTYNVNGIQYIAVFATNDSDRLVVDHWDGSNWNWDDLSLETSAVAGFIPLARHPNAITYLDQYSARQIKVFSVDLQFNLWNSSCNGACVATQGSWQGLWGFARITNTGSAGNYRDDYPTAAHVIASNGEGLTYLFGEGLDTGTIDAFYSADDYDHGYYYSWLDIGLPGDANGDYVNAPF